MRRTLATLAAIGGALALLAGEPYSADLRRLAQAVAHEEDHVTPEELAAWVRDRKPGLRLIDVREPEEFAKGHVANAQNIPIGSIASAAFNPSDTIVLLSEGGAHAAQAWVFLEMRGYRNVFFLRGGVAAPASGADGRSGRRYIPGRDGC